MDYYLVLQGCDVGDYTPMGVFTDEKKVLKMLQEYSEAAEEANAQGYFWLDYHKITVDDDCYIYGQIRDFKEDRW